MSNFIFEIIDNGDEVEGVFNWRKNEDELFLKYYQACELYDSGDYEKAITRFRYLLKKDPSFFLALNRIGLYYFEEVNNAKALQYFRKAFKISDQEIPFCFKGKIRWVITENRNYLQTLYFLGLISVRMSNYYEAMMFFEKIIEYNPDDNQGVRYLLGDIHFLLRNYNIAEEYYKKNLEVRGIKYSYGLLLFKNENFIESIIQLASAIMEDDYIFRLLVFTKVNEEQEDSERNYDAFEYIKFTFHLWFEDKALDFLKNIYSSKTFMAYYEKSKTKRGEAQLKSKPIGKAFAEKVFDEIKRISPVEFL